jgi:hypothetical protein
VWEQGSTFDQALSLTLSQTVVSGGGSGNGRLGGRVGDDGDRNWFWFYQSQAVSNINDQLTAGITATRRERGGQGNPQGGFIACDEDNGEVWCGGRRRGGGREEVNKNGSATTGSAKRPKRLT